MNMMKSIISFSYYGKSYSIPRDDSPSARLIKRSVCAMAGIRQSDYVVQVGGKIRVERGMVIIKASIIPRIRRNGDAVPLGKRSWAPRFETASEKLIGRSY